MVSDKDYVPSANEEYMSPRQLEYFKGLLNKMKADIIEYRSADYVVPAVSGYEADMSDNASLESETYTESKTRDMQNRTLRGIERSLARIRDGEYGYCMESGKKIGVGRLLANPTAALCIEEQEKYEKMRKSYAGDEDDDVFA